MRDDLYGETATAVTASPPAPARRVGPVAAPRRAGDGHHCSVQVSAPGHGRASRAAEAGCRSAVSASAVRCHTRRILREMGTEVVDDAALVVSELVTNAFKHGGGGVELSLTWGTGSVLIRVRDSAVERTPIVNGEDGEAESGRGLMMVVALANDYGFCVGRDHKTVWARLASDESRGG